MIIKLLVKLYISFVCICFLFLGLCVFMATRDPAVGENVSAKDTPYRLPVGASNVSYYQPAAFGPCRAFEFTCEEIAFAKWLSSMKKKPVEITKPVSISRYTNYLIPPKSPKSVEIEDGLYYEYCYEDQGQYMGYDRKSKRCYCMSHSR